MDHPLKNLIQLCVTAENLKKTSGVNIPLSEEGKRCLSRTQELADELGTRLIHPEYILLAILEEQEKFPVNEVLKKFFNPDDVRDKVRKMYILASSEGRGTVKVSIVLRGIVYMSPEEMERWMVKPGDRIIPTVFIGTVAEFPSTLVCP